MSGLDRQDDRDQYFQVVQDNARETREKVLKPLMIRRTRKEIMEFYGEDLKKQGLKFPEVADPEPSMRSGGNVYSPKMKLCST